MEHPSHKLDAYQDSAFKWVTFCSVCGKEEENLSCVCPGKYENKKHEKVDTSSELT